MEPFIGTICPFAFNFAPYNWALCNGQQLQISTNTALFSLLGVQYGGNGQTTFGLPDLQGRAATGQGKGQTQEYINGDEYGSESITVQAANMPVHMHTVALTINADNGSVASADQASPANNYPGFPPSRTAIYAAQPTANVYMGGSYVPSLAGAGSATPVPVEHTHPYLAVTYCIALQGYFPQRQ